MNKPILSSNSSFGLVQIDSNGSLDLDFEGGVRFVDFDIGTLHDFAWDVVIQGDGSAVVIGSVQNFGENWEFAATRFDADGFESGNTSAWSAVVP